MTTNNISSAADLSGKVAFDANGLNSLKQAARENSPEAIKGVARQFEAIFMNMMLKSMREASPQDNPFDNEQSRTFTSMLDQQLSSNLASKGLGLADVLARQLSKTGYAVHSAMEQAVSDKPTPVELTPYQSTNTTGNAFLNSAAAALNQRYTSSDNPVSYNPVKNISATQFKPLNDNSSAVAFQQRMTHHAQAASMATGIPAHLMLGQAALESGWGKRELKADDGTPSYNLFGIKASGNWDGKVIEATTSEYVNGIKLKRVERFRAYDSYEDSFKDFANLMRNNPRYENVLANLQDNKGYAQAMQRAGYATDPNYAAKLSSVLQRFSPS